MIRIAIAGAAGRVGQRIVALARNAPNRFEIVATMERGQTLDASPQVLLDFTEPGGMRGWLDVCRERKIALVSGTTGLSDDDEAALDRAATEIPVLHAPNMSVGIGVLMKLVAEAARQLGDDCDVEIVEAHHRFKKDAPSGTAKALHAAIGGQAKLHSLRIGDEIGVHTVYLAMLGERLELTHRATSRDTFAAGALRAAEFLAAQKRGRYTMADVLAMPPFS